MADVKRVPLWVWGVCVAGALLLALLHRRTAAAHSGAASYTSGVTAAPVSSGNGAMAPTATTPTSLPSQYNPPAPSGPAAPATPSFMSLFNDIQTPRSFAAGTATLDQLAQRDPQNTAYQNWVQSGYSFGVVNGTPGANVGNSQNFATWVNQGRQFIGSQSAIDQGQAAPTPIPQPAGGGGGGYMVHPDAPASTGRLSDLFGLAGPNNPSHYGAM